VVAAETATVRRPGSADEVLDHGEIVSRLSP
jgi:hypothetical protein